jgi:hypothetical protein
VGVLEGILAGLVPRSKDTPHASMVTANIMNAARILLFESIYSPAYKYTPIMDIQYVFYV